MILKYQNRTSVPAQRMVRRLFGFGFCLIIAIAFSSPAVAQNKIKDLTFDDVKFEMKKGDKFQDDMLSDDITALNGKTVKIRGYIRPSLKQKGITKFVFVRDNKECCFGPGAMLYDCMLVMMEKGTSVNFTVRPITIQGTFYIKKFKGPDGKVWAIYRMKNVCKL